MNGNSGSSIPTLTFVNNRTGSQTHRKTATYEPFSLLHFLIYFMDAARFRAYVGSANASLSQPTGCRYFRRPRTTHGPNTRVPSSFAQGSPLVLNDIFENSNG